MPGLQQQMVTIMQQQKLQQQQQNNSNRSISEWKDQENEHKYVNTEFDANIEFKKSVIVMI